MFKFGEFMFKSRNIPKFGRALLEYILLSSSTFFSDRAPWKQTLIGSRTFVSDEHVLNIQNFAQDGRKIAIFARDGRNIKRAPRLREL